MILNINFFSAAIIRVDGKNITKKLLKEYELRVQFGSDEKVGYNVINKNMSIYELIEKNENKDFDYATVADLLGNNTKASDILKICKTCRLVDEFLDYIGKTGEYQIAEDLKIYWPLEPLSQYLSNESKNLTQLEINQRKHLFFDYLLTLDVALITQNLRDGLIKKVFKNDEATKKLIIEHNEKIGNKIKDVINNANSVTIFNDLINELKNSKEAVEDKEAYEKAVQKEVSKNQLDVPLKECINALKSLENVNVKPLVNASNIIAEKKLSEISSTLNEIEIIIKKIKSEMQVDNE